MVFVRQVICVVSSVTVCAVVHDPCWVGLPDDADVVVEGRILSAALRNLQALCRDDHPHQSSN